MMNWPNGLMAATLIALILSIVVPWKLPPRFRIGTAVLLIAISVITWNLYEARLTEIARPGDPLIRVDLFLIIPLLIASICSLLTSFFTSFRRLPRDSRIK